MYEWTFCTDELPDQNGDYLILWKMEGVNRIAYEIQEFYDGEWALYLPQAGKRKVTVIAWMDLPKVPEGV